MRALQAFPKPVRELVQVDAPVDFAKCRCAGMRAWPGSAGRVTTAAHVRDQNSAAFNDVGLRTHFSAGRDQEAGQKRSTK